jgi:uncharacterized protein (TIGR02147 family)
MQTLPDILQNELQRRRSSNPRYSLRAFSKDLGLSPGFMSHVLAGNRQLSDENAYRIAKCLKLPSEKRQAFVAIAQSARSKSPSLKTHLRRLAGSLETTHNRGSPRVLRDSQWKLFSHWCYPAILELADVKPLPNNASTIAKRLGLQRDQVAAAIRSLVKAKLLREEEDLLFKNEDFYSTPDIPSAEVRRCHKSMLVQGAQALDEQPITTRDFSSVVVAIDPAKIGWVKNQIEEFRLSLLESLQSGDRSKIFALNIQFFQLEKGV